MPLIDVRSKNRKHRHVYTRGHYKHLKMRSDDDEDSDEDTQSSLDSEEETISSGCFDLAA